MIDVQRFLLFTSLTLTLHTYPEFDEEEGVLGAFSIQLLQPSLLLWKFVINLTDVHRLQQGVTVRMICLPNMYEEVLVVLKEGRKKTHHG